MRWDEMRWGGMGGMGCGVVGWDVVRLIWIGYAFEHTEIFK